MKSIGTNLNWPLAAILVLAFAFLGLQQSQALRPLPAQPSVVATVNLETLFNELDERKAVDERVKVIATDLEEQANLLRESVQLLESDLALLAPGTKEHLETEEDLVRESGRLKAFIDFAAIKLDRLESKYLRDLYEKIKAASGELAMEHGIDIVFVDDSIVDLPVEAQAKEMMRQISARRTLYTNEGIDVTEELMMRMNNEFSARP